LTPSTHHIFPFILLAGFDQKASIKIGENPNLERKKRESSPTSMEVWRKVATPLLGFGQEQRWGGHHVEGKEEAAHRGRTIGLTSIETRHNSKTENLIVTKGSS
jgi:hypothetical protein